MSNYVLAQGFSIPAGQTVTYGLCAVQGSGNRVAQTAGAAAQVLGVFIETVDTAKVATGKVVAGVQLMGEARVIAGAAVSRGDHLTTDASGRAVTKTKAIAGAQPGNSFGVAMTPASSAGDIIEVILTPFDTF
jgi:hypothetical protein